MPREQRFDVLIEPIGRSEEQIALQRHTLNLKAVIGQKRLLLRSTIKRRAVFRAVEAELDRVHAAYAERKGRASDHNARQDAGNKTPIDDEERDGDQRQVVDTLQLPRRLDQQWINKAGAKKKHKPGDE